MEEVLANGASAPGSGPGMTLPLVDSAAGHVLMGGMTPAARSALPLTRAMFARMEERINAATERGWAKRSDAAGHVEIAVPIRAEGRPPMALSLSTPPTASAAARPGVSIETMIPEMRGVARSIAAILAPAHWIDPDPLPTTRRENGDE